MSANLYLSEADIEALSVIGFDAEVVINIRKTLDVHHERIFKQQTDDFLSQQYHKLINTTDTQQKIILLWEVINWKENYKSPYLKDGKEQ